MMAVEVAHLVKRYRGARRSAVDDISFDVAAGQLFCLLGPNSAGKTTTVSILTTTLAPTSGRVRIAGRDLVAARARVRRELGVVFQQPSLDLNLTAEENIRLHAVLYGLYPWRPTYRMMTAGYRRQVQEVAAVLDLSDLLGQPARALSGGLRRRLRSSGRSCTGPACCSWTSPPRAWTRRAGAACGRTCGGPGPRWGPPCS